MLPKTLFLLLLPVLRALADPSAPQEPLGGSSKLICHPGIECYPKTFVPTADFQTVHDDQELPPGLHYRLNMETGVKEAKIWDHQADSDENAVVVVDPESSTTISSETSEEPPSIPLHGSGEDGASSEDTSPIKPPRDGAPSDSKTFSDHAAALSQGAKSSHSELLDALSGLEDLVHEIYWGTQLAGSHFQELLDLATGYAHADVRASAALVLGSACSNNPKAVTKGREKLGGESIVKQLMDALELEKDMKAAQRQVFALSQMVKDEKLQKVLQDDHGLSRLVTILVTAQDPTTKGKVALLIEDAFLKKSAESSEGKEAEGKLCEVLQDELVRPGVVDDIKEKMFSALVSLKSNNDDCEANTASLEWINMISRMTNGRTLEQIEDDGETLLGSVLTHRNMFLREFDEF